MWDGELWFVYAFFCGVLNCFREARDDECDGLFQSSSRGCFTNQRFRRSAMSSGSVINLASSSADVQERDCLRLVSLGS